MSLKQINGIVFKQMVINGANNLANRSKYVDQLNVFPVPDGDTGTNMSMTMTAGAKELVSLEEASIGKVAKVLSRGLLMGARGNSGVILSQLFRGFATGLEGKDEADIEDIAKALESGVKTAYKAVMKPIEGTILTVARESAEAAGAKYETVETIVDLYDLVSHTFIEQNVTKETEIQIKSTEAVIVLEIPVDEGDNQYKIDRKVEHSVTANVPVATNIVGISQYEPISDNYPIDLEIKSTDDAAVSDITIYIDGRPVFKNVTYTQPYVVKVDELVNGYHLLEAEVTTNTGVKDYSYARIFIQKEENPYLINAHAHDLANWTSYKEGSIQLREEYKEVVIGRKSNGGAISEPFEIDFSQVPMLDLQVEGFTGTWSLILKDVSTDQEFYLLKDSTESGHIITSMSYALNKLNSGRFSLLGKHEVQLAIVTDSDDSDVTVNSVRIFNQGLQPLREREWKSSFTTQKVTHWQSRLNALAKINYYQGTANVLNLNPNGNGGMQTSYFEVDLSKKPQFKIKVEEADQLWSLLVYVESSDRGYYLQYPTDKTGTFTYDINKALEKALSKEELESKLNLQFWIISNGEYGSEVKIDYLRLEYSKNWIELIAIGTIAILSVIAICVNLNKNS